MLGAMAKSIPEELDKIAAQQKKLEERAKRLKQQQQYRARKAETRTKIIAGAALLAAVRDSMVSETFLAQVLNRYVTRKNEREFMELDVADEPGSEETRGASEK